MLEMTPEVLVFGCEVAALVGCFVLGWFCRGLVGDDDEPRDPKP